MQPGSCQDQPVLDVVSAFQSYGKFLEMGSTPEAEKIRLDTVRNSCRKEGGSCGGMYTANTMASAAEAMGMTLPYSSSTPAAYKEKQDECDAVGPAMRRLLENNIRPRDIMTRAAFENAMVLTMILGGSTNAVLHLIAIAHSCGVKLGIDDFQAVSDRIPFVADLKPSGKYVMEDVHKIGGIPAVLKYLLENKLVDGDIMTVTGKTLAENLDPLPGLQHGQDVIRPLDKPIKSTGHIRILKGNLAPGGCVSKITGKEGLTFEGKARVFDNEEDVYHAIENKSINTSEKTVIVLRYLGPKGGPGASPSPSPTRSPSARPSLVRAGTDAHPPAPLIILLSPHLVRRHARDAQDDLDGHGRRPGSARRVRHRRPLLGRHARLHGRPRRPRGVRRRQHCARAGRRRASLLLFLLSFSRAESD